MEKSFHLQCGAASVVQDEKHPNKLTLKGVLVRLDEPSTRAPHGSEGHRIYVPKDVAQRRLNTLKGMGLNYSTDFKTHAQRRKVGVIDKAFIRGKDLCVEATVWKHDFPEAEKDLKQPGLGMSMELGDVSVEDPKADVWRLSDFCFLGATVLWKRNAAYYQTEAIAAAAAKTEGRYHMKTAKKKVVAGTPKPEIDVTNIASLAAEAAVGAIQPTLIQLARGQAKLSARLDEMDLDMLSHKQVAAGKGEEEDDEEACKMENAKEEEDDEEEAAAVAAAKKKNCDDDDDSDDGGDDDDEESDDDDDEMDSGADDESKLEKLGPKTDDDEESDDLPGQLNKGATNKGDKTTSENKVGKTVNEAVLGAKYVHARKQLKRMRAEMAAMSSELAKYRKTVKANRRQLAAAAEGTERRSMCADTDPMVIGMLQKSGLNAREMQASGQKLTISEADAVIKALFDGSVDPRESMALKNKLLEAELMEQGYAN